MKKAATWSDIKTKLSNIDRPGLLVLLQDLYAANKDNQTFLHARFDVGGDILKPYKATISRWLWPDLYGKLDHSVAKAKKAIADYKKAIGRAEDTAELMVFYCEQAAGFASEVGLDDGSYYDALVRMYAQALKSCDALPLQVREDLHLRLKNTCALCCNFGYGVYDEVSDLLAMHGIER
ncbi:MAG: hypothetical protein WB821_08395 [Burkholderiaceae bacterium]